jgi:hypothetical protein
MRRLLICSVSAIGLAYAGSAAANSPKLKGVYAFTGSAACLVSAANTTTQAGGPSPGGFNSNLQPNGGSRVWSTSFSVEGVRIFNGDGTGTIKGTSVNITAPPTPAGFTCPNPGCFPPSAGSSNFEASFTYTIDNDGVLHTQLVGLMTGTTASGPGSPGSPAPGGSVISTTFTVDGPPLVGLIGDNGKTLTIAHLEPAVETITQTQTTTVGPPNVTVTPRICHRSRVLVKIKDDPIN